jgi:hypothetical protein
MSNYRQDEVAMNNNHINPRLANGAMQVQGHGMINGLGNNFNDAYRNETQQFANAGTFIQGEKGGQ